MAQIFALKRRGDTAANWTSNATVLLERQLGFQTDGGEGSRPLMKFGDGATAWGSLPFIARKNNLTATTSPTVSNDNTQYYEVGSLWSNVNAPASPLVYILTSATTGAANWQQINAGGGGGSAAWGSITGTLSAQTDLQAALDAKVATTGNETIAGVKTFSSFPVTPSSAPTTDYQAANKKYVDDSPSTAANTSLVDTDLVVAPFTNVQDFADGIDSAVLKARGTGVSSSYVSTVAVGGTTFAQPAVSGEINSDEGYFSISYAGATGITVTTLSVDSTYIYIDNTGALQQQVTEPTRQDWSRKMFTMRIAVDAVAETIIGFEYLNNPIGHYSNSIRDLYTALLAQGVPFKVGQTITGRATDLGFNASAGTIMEFGGTGDINNANLLDIDEVTNATYDLLTRTTIAFENLTDLVKFWDNAGTITALGSTTVVGHRLYRFSNGQFAMQYGQGNYANISLARAGVLLEDYVLNPRLVNATFFGWWLIQETATNTGGTTLTDFREYNIGVQGGSSSVLAGCLLQGNNLSDLLDADAAIVNLGITATAAEIDLVIGGTSAFQAQIDALSIPDEEDIRGTALYSASVSGTVTLNLTTFTAFYAILTGNTTLAVNNTPASGKTFTRSLKIVSTATESLTLPAAWNVIGTYAADTTVNDLQIEFTNFPTVGLVVTVYINQLP